MIFQDPRAHINPVRSIGDFMTEALRTNRGVARGEARARAVAALDDVGIDDGERRLQQYPARALRRAAAARDDRVGAADRAAAAARRRADHGAGRHHPGRGDGDPRRAAPRSTGWRCCSSPTTSIWPTRSATAPCVMYAGADRRGAARPRRSPTRPLHPYTASLSAARPAIDGHVASSGGDPRAGRCPRSRRPTGCAFAPRCDFAQDALHRARPRSSSRSAAASSRCLRATRAARSGRRRRSLPTETVPERRRSLDLAASGLRKEYGPRGRGRRRRSQRRRRRLAGDRRRVGLGQDDDRPDARRPDQADRGDDRRLRARPLDAGALGRRAPAARGARSRSSSRTRTRASNPRHSAEHALDEVLRLHGNGRDRPSRAAPASRNWASWSASTSACCARCRGRCPAASASGSRSPGRWRPSRA